MKILIHSNGPHVSTGYGVQCGLLAEHLRASGHDVAISCTYGQQGQTGTWRGITLYPNGYETNGNDIIHNHAMHHFGGDPANGWIITILDTWCMVNPLLKDFNIAAWCPVDHYPVPQDVLKFFHNMEAIPVAMSKYGERELVNAGLAPTYIPLGVDTTKYKPTLFVQANGEQVSARKVFDLPDDAFVVGMVAMNKGWAKDRKGFNEAFRAFGAFWKQHQEAVLFLHSEKFGGADGINLVELATHCAIPDHAVVWVDQYAYRLGMPAEMMAAAYTAMDVLLAPSHGEGFCVPLIEAQACGTPVVTSNFSAQPELVGAGYTVLGQPEWDPAQHASYVIPYIPDIVAKLEEVYEQPRGVVLDAVEFAQQYDFTRIFEERWVPFLAELAAEPEVLPLEREPIPEADGVVVLVPVMRRPENVAPLVESWVDSGQDGCLLLIVDDEDWQPYLGVLDALKVDGVPTGKMISATRGSTFAQKVNSGVEQTTEPWVFICGDDVRFHPGWLDEARKLSDRYDVIGTNDTTGPVKNPDVAAGRHADHFFVRRAYVDEYGACLDGPGVLAPECYGHWFTDKEIVQLAKARGVFTPCLTSIVEHLHPGYDGKPRDAVYEKAMDTADEDRKTFLSRAPLIEMQRTSKAKLR